MRLGVKDHGEEIDGAAQHRAERARRFQRTEGDERRHAEEKIGHRGKIQRYGAEGTVFVELVHQKIGADEPRSHAVEHPAPPRDENAEQHIKDRKRRLYEPEIMRSGKYHLLFPHKEISMLFYSPCAKNAISCRKLPIYPQPLSHARKKRALPAGEPFENVMYKGVISSLCLRSPPALLRRSPPRSWCRGRLRNGDGRRRRRLRLLCRR